jgi:hypothetical protein
MRKLPIAIFVGCLMALAAYVVLSKPANSPTTSELEFGPRFTAAVVKYGCTQADAAYACLQAVLNDTLDEAGPTEALAIVKKIDAQVAPEPFACHPLVHGVGRRLVSRQDVIGLEMAIASDDPVCGSGFIHGAFEALGTKYSGAELESVVSLYCDKVSSDIKLVCMHASGHAFAISSPKDIESAINGCAVFDPNSGECARGVLMAYAIGSPRFSELHDPAWDSSWGWVGFEADSLNGACYDIRPDWQVPCWEFIWNGYVYHADSLTPKDYFSHCPDPSETHRELCVQNGGRLLLYTAVDGPAAVQSCAELSSDRAQCLRGVALGLSMIDDHLGVPKEERISICSDQRWTREEREQCLLGEADAEKSADSIQS